MFTFATSSVNKYEHKIMSTYRRRYGVVHRASRERKKRMKMSCKHLTVLSTRCLSAGNSDERLSAGLLSRQMMLSSSVFTRRRRRLHTHTQQVRATEAVNSPSAASPQSPQTNPRQWTPLVLAPRRQWRTLRDGGGFDTKLSSRENFTEIFTQTFI